VQTNPCRASLFFRGIINYIGRLPAGVHVACFWLVSPAELTPEFDIAIIGGGVNGCGIARDAAGRGAKVLLLEADDLASGTSSKSTKLIHGGLRYLEHYEFGLVRESLVERERLWGIAPHAIYPLRFVLPNVPGLRPRWLVRAGLFLYDHIGGRERLPATETVSLASHPAGPPLKPQFTTAFVYSDCWVDDARLVVLNARDAADRGAQVLTRRPVTALRREHGRWLIEAGGITFRAGAIVNAAGPEVLEVLGFTRLEHGRAMRLVRGSHIVVPKLFDHPFAYFFQLADKRIFFAIPYEHDFTLIGTTDVDHDGGPIEATPEEIEYLCSGASQFFRRPVTPADVVWTYSGVRPLLDDGSGRPEATTRGYELDLSDEAHGAPLLSVFGGKITTYRHLAAEAVGELARRLPALRGDDWTGDAPLPGGDFPIDGANDLTVRFAEEYPFLADAAERIVRAYGTDAFRIFDGARSLDDCGANFGHGLTQREVRHLVTREWACTAEDVLWRRTKLGLRFSASETAALDTFIAQELHA
jgi:glycerol-3-phosphate dehydrogenase